MVLKRELIYGGLFGDEVLGVRVPARDVVLRLCDQREAGNVIRRHHYSQKAISQSYFNAIVEWGGHVNGALMLGYGLNVKSSDMANGDTIQFDRMWLSDAMPKLSETVVLGALHTLLRAALPHIKRIITYSDTSEGNMGTIYRAANYQEVGRSPSSFFRMPDGEKVHTITLWHRGGTTLEDRARRELDGIRKIHGDQIKFEYWL